jgi:hypothetical protein
MKYGVFAISPLQNRAEQNMKRRADYAPNPHQAFPRRSGG